MRGESEKVLLSGAGGLVGTVLAAALKHAGWKVIALSRSALEPDTVQWDPMSGKIDRHALEGCVYAIHLAGENIAGGRWTKERKRLILESRSKGTHLLAVTLASLNNPPRTLISASGSNFYKDNEGGDPWDESGPSGDGFLSNVCRSWEAATQPARDAGIRVVNARMGAVLSTRGGMLTRFLPAVCSGFGGVVGNGRQRISWIHEADLCRAFLLLLEDDRLSGAVNVVSPNPVSNRDFVRELASFLHRPGFIPMPRQAVLWLFGEMGEELLLQDNAVSPTVLEKAGMMWEFPNLLAAFSDLLGRNGCRSSRS